MANKEQDVKPGASSSLQLDPETFDPYKKAIRQLRDLKTKKRITDQELNLIESAASFNDVVESVRLAQLKSQAERSAVVKFLSSTTQHVVSRLDRFGRAVDMMAQCSKVSGLVWGSLRFFVIVRQFA
jgi:hypothetical protein